MKKDTHIVVGLIVLSAIAACSDGAVEGESVLALSQASNANGGGNGGGNGRITNLDFPNATGVLRTYTDNAKETLKPNKSSKIPFFQSLGTNGRACVHCHVPGDAWGITPADLTYRFSHPLDVTNLDCLVSIAACPLDPNPQNYGVTDPIFRVNDGAVSPRADVSTPQARQMAFSMLLRKGLVRVGLPIPATAEFTLAAVDDPYGYASAAELSLFRRPLPSTNLRTLAVPSTPTATLNAVMWDGRETIPGNDIVMDLLDQANGATLGHAQAIAGLSASDLQAIVDFETGLHTAQATDNVAGALNAGGANGGAEWLALNQPYYDGINDVVLGDYVTMVKFNTNAFSLFSAWAGAQDAAQAAIARGQALFDTKPITITGVAGLNDVLGAPSIAGSCTTCHDAPSYGHHSVKLPVDIGIASASRRTSDLPLYTLQNKITNERIQVTDPGRALISGKWADIGKFKGPILRGLAGRAPYFHNGSAATFADVLSFYQTRFGVAFTEQEKSDLAAFLGAL